MVLGPKYCKSNGIWALGLSYCLGPWTLRVGLWCRAEMPLRIGGGLLTRRINLDMWV